MKSEVGSRNSELGSRNLELGSRKLEVGTKKSEIRSPYPAFVQTEQCSDFFMSCWVNESYTKSEQNKDTQTLVCSFEQY